MAPLFGFLKRNRNKTTDGYASEPQSYTDTWVNRQRKANKGKFSDVFEPAMANGVSWDVRDGTMRPVYNYPVQQPPTKRRNGYDGPTAEEHAAWNIQNPNATLDRFGSVQSKATSFYPPISPETSHFVPAHVQAHHRARSSSIGGWAEYPSKSETSRNERQEPPSAPFTQPQPQHPSTQTHIHVRPSSRSSYLPPPPQHQANTHASAPQAQPPPRAPSDTLSEKMRRRTVSGPTPPMAAAPPNGEDPLKRMKNDLQVTSFLLNKLRGIHSDSSAQRYNTQQAASQRPSHRRAASSQGFTNAHNPVYHYDYRPEVDPVKLVDPYIDRRNHGTEFHQMMNHGLLMNPTSYRQVQEPSGRSRTRSDAAVHAPSTAPGSVRVHQSQQYPQSSGPSTSRRSRHASDVLPAPPPHEPIHVRHTSSAPTASTSRPTKAERRQEEDYPVFGNFRNPAQFPATAHLSVPSRHPSKEQERDARRDRERSRDRARREESRERSRREESRERSRREESRERSRREGSRERSRREESRDRERQWERERERSRERERERDAERARERDRAREREKERDRERSATLRKKRRESAPASTLAPLPEKITPIDSDDSGYYSTSKRTRDRKHSSSSATPKKPVPAGLPLDDTPGKGISPEAVAQGLSMTKSEKSDRRVRFRGGADSVITTPANQADFKGLPARPGHGRAK